MQEPEVSLRIAMQYIQHNQTCRDVQVSIDGAHIKTKNTVHFHLVAFMRENGYEKCDGDDDRWQGSYSLPGYAPKIIVSARPGKGDVTVELLDGKTLFVESKKFRSGSGGEYPAMREAIGQLMTGCPDRADVIPVVAVPYSDKSADLAKNWSSNHRIRNAGIRFMLVHEEGNIDFI